MGDRKSSAGRAAIPEPGPDQVLIRVEAMGVNFIEIYFRKGQYKATFPMTPGSEAAGTVEELGPGVNGFKPEIPLLRRGAGQLCGVRAGARGAVGQSSSGRDPGAGRGGNAAGHDRALSCLLDLSAQSRRDGARSMRERAAWACC